MFDYDESLIIKEGEEQRQYVLISIGNNIYGIEVKNVQEVLGQVAITRVPNTMPFMKGIIDLRDTMVPIVDLRLKFDLVEKEYDRDTVIIITEIRGILIGLVADSVSDVITIPMSQVQNTPHFSCEIDTDAVKGISKYEDSIIIILDVDKIFKNDELDMLTQKESV